MHWFNPYGLAAMCIIMIPNIIFAVRCKDGFADKWHCRPVEIAEQIGRFGCFGFMIFNIPGLCFGWPSEEAFVAYLIAAAVLFAPCHILLSYKNAC